MKNRKKKTSIIFIVILLISFAITTFALFSVEVSVENNIFHTGNIKININDGKSIINENEFNFEPGMVVEKSFFIKNEGSGDVYYKLYFDNIKGNLKNVLNITIKDKDEILFEGIVDNFTKEKVKSLGILKVEEKKNLTISFFYPKNKGNNTQNEYLDFIMCADAVQVKNNPEENF